jgi:hypothetical protein
MSVRWLCGLILAVGLVACGGGGGSSTPDPPPEISGVFDFVGFANLALVTGYFTESSHEAFTWERFKLQADAPDDECVLFIPFAIVGHTQPWLDAGSIVVNSGGIDHDMDKLESGGNYLYGSTIVASPSGLVTISGGGGPVIGAFEASFQMPAALDLLAPIDPIVQDRGDLADIPVQWTSTGSGSVLVVVQQELAPFDGSNLKRLTCRMTDDGEGVIKGAWLTEFAVTESALGDSLLVHRIGGHLFDVPGAPAPMAALIEGPSDVVRVTFQ